MNTSISEQDLSRFDSVFTRALRVTAVGWLFAATLSVICQALIARQYLATVMVIAVASGVVATIALVPGLVAGRGTSRRDHSTTLMVSVILRLTGTVALFLLCRYQLAASDELIAGYVIGWYVFLTVIEITTLARRLSEIDAKPFLGKEPELNRNEVRIGISA